MVGFSIYRRNKSICRRTTVNGHRTTDTTNPPLRLIIRLRTLPTIQRAGCLELFIREVPSSAERLVELDNDQTAIDLRLRQRQLRWIESLQGVENFDVAGQPFHVTHPGKPDRCQVFLYRLSLLGADVIVILARN